MCNLDGHLDSAVYYAVRSPPDAFHPVVRTHPFTLQRSLFISPRSTNSVKRRGEDEAQFLLDELFDHLMDKRFIYHHKWRPSDLIL